MRQTLLISLLLLLLCLMGSNCATTKPVADPCIPEGYSIIKTSVYQDLLDSCHRAKMELLNCLGREKK